jgi:hypothetical protein
MSYLTEHSSQGDGHVKRLCDRSFQDLKRVNLPERHLFLLRFCDRPIVTNCLQTLRSKPTRFQLCINRGFFPSLFRITPSPLSIPSCPLPIARQPQSIRLPRTVHCPEILIISAITCLLNHQSVNFSLDKYYMFIDKLYFHQDSGSKQFLPICRLAIASSFL